MVDIDDGFLTMMDDAGDTKEDIKLPDNDLGKEIRTKFDGGEQFMVTIIVSTFTEARIDNALACFNALTLTMLYIVQRKLVKNKIMYMLFVFLIECCRRRSSCWY